MADKILRVAAFILILAAFMAWVATGHSAECWDCLTRAGDWTDKWAAGEKVKGDIIVCQPAGSAWGTKERDTKKYKIITICGTRDEIDALTAHQIDDDGKALNRQRFSAVVVDDKPVIADKKTSLAVTPTDAKKAVESDLETYIIPGGPK